MQHDAGEVGAHAGGVRAHGMTEEMQRGVVFTLQACAALHDMTQEPCEGRAVPLFGDGLDEVAVLRLSQRPHGRPQVEEEPGQAGRLVAVRDGVAEQGPVVIVDVVDVAVLAAGEEVGEDYGLEEEFFGEQRLDGGEGRVAVAVLQLQVGSGAE